MTDQDSERGFIALISVLILSLVLLVAVLSLAQYGITSRFFLLDFENKTASEIAASGCIQSGIIKVVQNPEGNVTSPISSPIGCDIVSISANTPSTGHSLIRASSTVSGATTLLEVIWDVSGENIDEWKEVSTF